MVCSSDKIWRGGIYQQRLRVGMQKVKQIAKGVTLVITNPCKSTKKTLDCLLIISGTAKPANISRVLRN